MAHMVLLKNIILPKAEFDQLTWSDLIGSPLRETGGALSRG